MTLTFRNRRTLGGGVSWTSCHRHNYPAPALLAQRVETRGLVGYASRMSGMSDGYDAVRETYPAILTTAQVAEMLDLNVRTVLNMAGDGRLPASRLTGSRKFHFSRDQIIETLKANTVVPPDPARTTGG